VIYFIAAVLSSTGVRLFSAMMVSISALIRVPADCEQGPAFPDPDAVQPGVVQELLDNVNV
jgi:hypothetical protein